MLPAKHIHRIWTTDEETITQANFSGSASITFVNRADDPPKKVETEVDKEAASVSGFASGRLHPPKIRRCSAELGKLIPEWNKRRAPYGESSLFVRDCLPRSNSKNDHGLSQNHSISSSLISDSVEVEFKRRQLWRSAACGRGLREGSSGRRCGGLSHPGRLRPFRP